MRSFASHPTPGTRRRRWFSWVALAAGVGLLAFASCGRSRSIGEPSAATPVILISIDTLRSDHLPAYGYEGVKTPNIDALRADSILYERAYSHAPLTLPSHVSMLTGMLPAHSGVRDNIGYRVSDETPMLQELLKKNGYLTAGVVSALVMRRETLLSRGFDFYDDDVDPVEGQTVLGRVQRTGAESWAVTKSWLDANASSSRPFFLFLHLYDPHTPYAPPPPYPSTYDGEIAYVDSVIGNLIADLQQKGIYEKALIVLLSDHGEGLFDHGEEEHGFFVYREAIQVPLMVKLPQSRRAGATVKTPVQLIDLFPTILDRTATPPPKGGLRTGQSLLSFLDEEGPARPIYSETYYPRFHFGWSDVQSLILGDDHFIRAPQPELFNLAADPAEKKNVVEENRRTYVRMRAAIEPLIQEPQAPTNMDSETMAKLAALGYIGSTVPTKAGEKLADPKSMMGTFRQIRQAYTYFQNEKLPEALALIDTLLAENNRITDLWDLKSKTLYKMGRRRESLEAAKEGLRHVPGSISLLFDVANVAMALNDLETAEEHAEIAAEIEPGQAHEILSRIWLLRGDTERAEKEAKLALKFLVNPTKSLMILGSIEMDRANYTKALEYYDQAVGREGRWLGQPVENLHMNRGDAYARLGKNAEAEREFRTEIRNFPTQPRAYSSLVMLLVTQRRTDEATRIVFDAIKASPVPEMYVVMSETMKAIGDDRGALFWAYQGLQKFPGDKELQRLPKRLADATPALREHMRTN